MPHLLFLAVHMQRGFGVSVVVDAVARRLQARGVRVSIGCVHADDSFAHLDIHRVNADADAVQALALRIGASDVIAHTSPFFECLPAITAVRTWAWEHGDPDPDFFTDDRDARVHQRLHKHAVVYPRVTGVIAISQFIRDEIRWPAAQVINNGWEHVLDSVSMRADAAGAERIATTQARDATLPLQVGCLMRLGAGEARYKGNQLIRDIIAEAKSRALDLQFSLMGRGTEKDASAFRRQGVEVHLNASDAEREDFLQRIDVLLSPSLWEGCNLPAIEAQALGTPTIAFDTGAHPEFVAHLVSDIPECLALLSTWRQDGAALSAAGVRAKSHVRSRYSWDRATDDVLSLLLSH